MFDILLLVAAAFAAGVINSLAGGGSFLTFPSLVFAGVPPVFANASSTVAMVPSAIASGVAYRSDIGRLNEPKLRAWFAVSFAGGLAGAALLLVTSDRAFRLIAPWLLLFATFLFAFGRQISAAAGKRLHSHAAMLVVLFPIALYGGYFGGGIGIMLLAAFRLYGLTDIHAMNGIKALLSAALNAVAAAIFIVARDVYWKPALIMMLAGILGGFAGPAIGKRLHPKYVRGLVIVVGVIMTAYFFRISSK